MGVMSDDGALSFAHPLLARWFRQALGEPTPAQRQAWPPIVRGKSTLLLSPTGSGKTLSAFLVAINRLCFDASGSGSGSRLPSVSSEAAPGVGKTRVLYLSPLKALGVDIERNLRVPLAQMERLALQNDVSLTLPRVGIRSGDTPASERRRLSQAPPDILITTPESLFLMLSSRARGTLTQLETVIIDEIHALFPNKRGAHLMLSLERLEAQREVKTPLQRIGLSATARPAEEVARFLGGFEASGAERPVTIVDVSVRKELSVRVLAPDSGLVDVIRAHRGTMVFVNSRRQAERLAATLNEQSGHELAVAHHGSLSKQTRVEAEERLKQGELPAIVTTSALELGIDVGHVDLVVQVEPPASVASALQRFGRAGHRVGERSHGLLLPKTPLEVLTCAALVPLLQEGKVEPQRCPVHPLDVLAQHLISMVLDEPMVADAAYALVRGAVHFRNLPEKSFTQLLELLTGDLASPHFPDLPARLVWDRRLGLLSARRGARLWVTSNPGVIVDRGTYTVYLEGTDPPVRVGELDEEMVYETEPGDVFLLGSSSWRVTEIAPDRVWVAPAPGQPGQMPYWRGERPPRAFELGRRIGALSRVLQTLDAERARDLLCGQHGLEEEAFELLWDLLQRQQQQSQMPTERRLVVETFIDELGEQRCVLLAPFGGRVLAAWSMATRALLRRDGVAADVHWTDDGFALRTSRASYRGPMLEGETPVQLASALGLEAEPNSAHLWRWLFPQPERAEALLIEALPGSALFAARFRDNAERALVVPRRRFGTRLPTWVQRRRASALLEAALETRDFPLLLETLRECLKDVFDVAAWLNLLRQIHAGEIEVVVRRVHRPSPFALNVLGSTLRQFVEGLDAPTERRAQALAVDYSQLEALLGEPELRSLLDPDELERLQRELQKLERTFVSGRAGRGGVPNPVILRDAEDVYELLLHLGHLSESRLYERAAGGNTKRGEAQPSGSDAELEGGNDGVGARVRDWLRELERQWRVVAWDEAGERYWIAARDAARYRDALGVRLPVGLPAELLQRSQDPLKVLVLRYAKTHIPFRAQDVAAHFRCDRAQVDRVLQELVDQGVLLAGAFLPEGTEREYCHPEVIRTLKQRSLAKLRRSIEPVEPAALVELVLERQYCREPSQAGLEPVLERLQGCFLPWDALHSHVLASRVALEVVTELDALCSSGTVVWRGAGSAQDPRVALYLRGDYVRLAPVVEPVAGELAERLRRELSRGGARFFSELLRALGGFPNELLKTLWQMVWAGEVTNDTLAPLRALASGATTQPTARLRPRSSRRSLGERHSSSGRRSSARAGRSLADPPGSEGRWSLLPSPLADGSAAAVVARVEQLVRRFGVIGPEMLRASEWSLGLVAAYRVLRRLEEAGRIRRGYFVRELSPLQFAEPGAEVALRHRREAFCRGLLLLSAMDPANPYGAWLPWPEHPSASPKRAPGCWVVLAQGKLVAYLGRYRRQLALFDLTSHTPPSDLVEVLLRDFLRGAERAWLIESIDGLRASPDASGPAGEVAGALMKAGFRLGAGGMQLRRADLEA